MPDDPPDPGFADGRNTAFEQRIRDLEVRLQRVEGERDELQQACREARAAQRAAEALIRARDEILAAATHDLRNPLGTIVMGATALLENGASPDPRAQRVRAVAERIHRQAERMVRQIRDLADYPDVQAGRLVLERALHSPAALVATTRELNAPMARERGIAVETRVAADLPAEECDGERVVQALTSLLAIAIKATMRGQTIEIGAQATGRGAVFFVQHGAPATDGEQALFEPGWHSAQPGYRGAGLGFAIARGMVDAHGGQIWTESNGADRTVCFTLTRRDPSPATDSS